MSPFNLILIYGVLMKFCQKSVNAIFWKESFYCTDSPDKMENRLLVKDLQEWKFSPSTYINVFKRYIDPVDLNFVRVMKNYIFSRVTPEPLENPRLVAYSKDILTELLDMHEDITKTSKFVEFISGNYVLNSSVPLAHRYGGHQFGEWAYQLGDGRAILIGEYIDKWHNRWELQLKGAGKTPYSRHGDGRAVLRSSIREFLASEAMYYLGIPTTRAAAIIVADTEVPRDLMYDGHTKMEKCAVVLRIAQSWFRFGSFEILTKNNESQILPELVDFIIKEHYNNDIKIDDEKRYQIFFSMLTRLTIDLAIMWQSVGFTHGVLNTDNMSVLGLTIDYGPFGFLDEYDTDFTPNASDHSGRYSYGNQLKVVLWNVIKLYKALEPLMTDAQKEQAKDSLEFEAKYTIVRYDKRISEKLGLRTVQEKLTALFLTMMAETRADFTMTFRQLSETPIEELRDPAPSLWALRKLANHTEYNTFYVGYLMGQTEEGTTEDKRIELMCKRNPRYVLRNWMLQQAIEKANNNDFSEVDRLLRILKNPFTKQEEAEAHGYASPPPDWAKNLKLSCSS